MTSRKGLYVALLLVGALAGAPWALTQAVWGDSADIDANTFSTGTITLSTNPTTALVSFAGMLPGDQVTAPVTVSNDGAMDMRYAMTTAVTNSTLGDGLTLAVKSGVLLCDDSGFGLTGTSLYSGSLTAGAIGDPAQGADTGDRALAASATETLCFQVALPTTASNALQNTTTTATFTFAGEQTLSNP
ncbi:MAG TPA: TasA family protein [Actinomycetota bacterium]